MFDSLSVRESVLTGPVHLLAIFFAALKSISKGLAEAAGIRFLTPI
jgi:hypothetical protein